MVDAIVKINDMYLMWSTIVDAPITYGMTFEQLVKYYAKKYEHSDEDSFREKMMKIDEDGTGFQIGTNTNQIGEYNRAGPNESLLSIDEIYKSYCKREKIRDGWEA